MKSRKALYEALKGIPGAVVPKTYKGLSNEVYGKKAVCYPSFTDMAARRAGERALTDLGFKVETNYGGDNYPVTSVPVSYFKGWHWDE